MYQPTLTANRSNSVKTSTFDPYSLLGDQWANFAAFGTNLNNRDQRIASGGEGSDPEIPHVLESWRKMRKKAFRCTSQPKRPTSAGTAACSGRKPDASG